MQALCALFVYIFCPFAQAHPLGGALPAHMVRVTVRPEAVEVDYRLRLPLHEAKGELRSADVRGTELGPEAQLWVTQKLEELAQGLRLTVDGRLVPWTRVSSASPEGDSRYLHLDQVLRAEGPFSGEELVLSQGNYPDLVSFYRSDLLVGGGLRLRSTSLVDVEGGRVRQDRDTRWSGDEAARELHIQLAAPPGPLLRALEGLAGGSEEPVPAAAALDLGPVHALRSGRLPPLAVCLALLGAALSGGRGPLRPQDGLALALCGICGLGASPALAGLSALLWGLGRWRLPEHLPRQALGWGLWGLASLAAASVI